MTAAMRGIWLERQEVRVRNDLPVPEPPEGEVLVRVVRAGICNTDLELVRGYYPFSGVLGHEFVGIVERGPDGLVGSRVVGEINAVCGSCPACRRGERAHCDNRTVLGIVGRNGVFAQYTTLPEENVHVVPNGIATDVATFVEPLAAALEIQQQSVVQPADRVLVVGAGKLGNLIAQTLALTGCDVLAVDRHPRKLALLSTLGIATGTSDAVDPGTFDVAVECTGNADGFACAQRAVRPRGTLVMKSTYAGTLSLDAAAVVVNELTMIGSRCGPFQPALELLASGRVTVEPLIHARYPLEQGIEALEHAQRAGVLKVLLDC